MKLEETYSSRFVLEKFRLPTSYTAVCRLAKTVQWFRMSLLQVGFKKAIMIEGENVTPIMLTRNVQFFFSETKSKDEVSRYWLWDSHRENPVVGFEKRLPYLPQDQRSRTDPYLDIPPRWAVG